MTLRLQKKGSALSSQKKSVIAMVATLASGCGVEATSEQLGGGGKSQGTEQAAAMIERGKADESNALNDSRWDAPDEYAQTVAPPANATTCTANNQCPTGFCVDGFCCDAKCDYPCMACSAAKKGSGVDGVCGSIAYDTDPDNDCPVGACDGKNQCKNYNGVACKSAAACLSNYCVDGVCCGNICMGSCQACSAAKKGSGNDGVCGSIKAATDPDNECNPGECNGSGACNVSPQPLNANGAACTSAAQCQSGYCADGVCCDSWCLGTCMACSAAKKGGGADGTCGFVANDKDFGDECWAGACNGAGVCKQYNGLPCTDKSQCLSNYCADGVCCGNVCNQFCYACTTAKKGYGYDGVCEPITAERDLENECNPGECNGSGVCNQPQTPLVNGTPCVSFGQCASGNCVDGVCCDTACTGNCTACTAAKKGGGTDGTCGNIKAETDPDKECGAGRCGGNGVCRYYNGTACTSAAQCFSNYCVDGFCCGNICTSSCYACSNAKKGTGYDGVCAPINAGLDPDNECSVGECNGSGACNAVPVLLANGAACSSAAQCSSGFCVDGVCCDAACSGTCLACTATKKGSGTDGTCGNIKYDTDPDSECANGACSGAGTCKYYNGVACTTTTECLSNYCVDGVCCGNICNLTCMACTAAKKFGGYDGACGMIANNSDPDNECASTCNGAGACNKAPNGTTCATAADCSSGFCVDGYCCNVACAGACEACNLLNLEGICSNSCITPCTGTLGLPTAPISPNMTRTQFLKAITAADFNADGIQDLVGVLGVDPGVGDSGIHVFMGQGNGAFAAPVKYWTGAYELSVATADLNGDAKADIIAAGDETGRVTVYLGQGNGSFTLGGQYATGTGVIYSSIQPNMLVIDDLNGDGIRDAATANSNSVSLLMGQGNGSFAPKVDLMNLANPNAITTGDFDADGKVDLALTTRDSGYYGLTILNGQGGGTFGNGVHYPLNANSAPSITKADLNGDGRLDLAVTYYLYVTNAYKLGVFVNQGNGTFANPVVYDAGGGGEVIATNLNGDANVDLAVAATQQGAVRAFLGVGNGTFAPSTAYTVRDSPYALVAVDLDNDNDKDLATGNRRGLEELINSGLGTFGRPIDSDPKLAMKANFVFNMDANADGKLDLVGVNDSAVKVAFGDGNGAFGPTTVDSLSSAPAVIQNAKLADLNADGKKDLILVTSTALRIRLNQGSGVFGPETNYTPFGSPSNPVVGDFNNDGNQDVALSGVLAVPVAGQYSTYNYDIRLSIWYGNGTGALGARQDDAISGYEDFGTPYVAPIGAGDVNADGWTDFVISGADWLSVGLLLNQGTGQFQLSSNTSLLVDMSDFDFVDLNGDGALDLVAMNHRETVRMWLNDGTGNLLQPSVDYPAPTNRYSYQMSTADMNGDGFKDVVIANHAAHIATVLLNQGNGSFGNSLDYPVGFEPTWVTAGDWNGDGRMDLAVPNAGSGTVSILQGVCLP